MLLNTQGYFRHLNFQHYKYSVKMVTVIKVDFRQSKIEKLKELGKDLPQFFDCESKPLRIANQYMRKRASRLAYKSLITTAEHLKEFLDWLTYSNLDIKEITDDFFDSYIDALCSYRKPSGDPLSWNTVNARSSGAYRFLLWSHEQGYCHYLNPSEAHQINLTSKQRYKSKGHPSKQISAPISFLQLDQAIEFIDALADISGKVNQDVKRRNKLVGALMLQTGLRISEVCNFPLKDLPEVNSKGHSTPARVIGKGDKARAILIPNQLLLKLWEYVDIDRERLVEKIENLAGDYIDDSLFISEKGQKLTPNWIQKLFRKTKKFTGINSHPHILRHTFGTYHYLLNRDLTGLAKLMGHESEVTTQQYYIHTATLVSYTGSYSGLQSEIDRLIRVDFE